MSVRWSVRLAVLATAFTSVLFAFAPAALAASTYFDQSPPVDGVSTGRMPKISVKVSDPVGISTGFQIKVDGSSKSPKVTWIDSNTCQMTYQYTSPLANGSHTVYASVFTYAGRTSTTWKFDQKVPPALGPMAPADGSTTTLARPTISVGLALNGVGLSSSAMTVDGVPVPATYDATAKTLSYTPTTDLANDRVHTVSVSATDAAGVGATVSWSFRVQVYAEMNDTSGCSDCHVGYPTSHPMTDCEGCHDPGAPFPAYWNMDDRTPHGTSFIADVDCTYCHSDVFSGVPRHAGSTADVHASATDMSGCSCHVRSLTVEHNRYLTEGGGAFNCLTCHASPDPRVVTAIRTGSTSCADCHDLPTGHPYADIDHVADIGETLDASGLTCGACHSVDLAEEHDKPSSSSTGQGCAVCHPAPRDSFDVWEDGCSQGSCHAAGTATAIHGGIDAAHAVGADDCTGPGCHAGSGDIASIHSNATTVTAGETRSGCRICHAAGAAPTSDCTGCHDTGGHGDLNALHTSGVDCYGSCHTSDLASDGHVADCGGCHGTEETRVAAAIQAGTTECGACHRAGGSYLDSSGRAYVLVGGRHDGLQPVISDVEFDYLSDPDAPVLRWTTDRPCTTYVDYTGPDWAYDGSDFDGYTFTAGSGSLTTSHAVSFPAAAYSSSSGYHYYYRIRTVDAQGRVAVSARRTYHRNRSGDSSIFPSGYEPDHASLNTDGLQVNIVRSDGSKAATSAVAGWESRGPASSLPTPEAPGTPVPQETLAKARSTSQPGAWWRTGLATADGDYNWQIAEFRFGPDLLQGMQGLEVAWTGYGENSEGHPVVIHLWNFDTRRWERIDSRQSTGANTWVRVADSADPAQHYCLRCHATPVSPDVTMPSELTNMRVSWSTDYHGAAVGTGAGGSLKAPYARGQAAISCDVCHEPSGHGESSGNLAKIRSSVNGKAVTMTSGTEAYSLCSACHEGTPDAFHGSCISCHETMTGTYHNITGLAPKSFAGSDCLSCHRHGRSGYAPGCHGCHNEPCAGPWTTF